MFSIPVESPAFIIMHLVLLALLVTEGIAIHRSNSPNKTPRERWLWSDATIVLHFVALAMLAGCFAVPRRLPSPFGADPMDRMLYFPDIVTILFFAGSRFTLPEMSFKRRRSSWPTEDNGHIGGDSLTGTQVSYDEEDESVPLVDAFHAEHKDMTGDGGLIW